MMPGRVVVLGRDAVAEERIERETQEPQATRVTPLGAQPDRARLRPRVVALVICVLMVVVVAVVLILSLG
jgi:hypothetical protein